MAAWVGPTATAPNGNTPPPINEGTVEQLKRGPLGVSDYFGVIGRAYIKDSLVINNPTLTPDGGLLLDVNGKVGAMEYCDENGNNCVATSGIGAQQGSLIGSCRVNAAGCTVYHGPVTCVSNACTCPAGYSPVFTGEGTRTPDIYYSCAKD